MGTSSRGADLIRPVASAGDGCGSQIVDGFLSDPTAVPGQET